MANVAPLTASNRYYQARMEAAKRNERLSSQEGASEAACISLQRLKHIERGLTPPYADEVVMLAAEYNAPELMNHFCVCECPIGRKMIPRAELIQLDRLTIKILNAVDGVKDVGTAMRLIADDGEVTPEEVPKLREVMTALAKISKVAAEMRIWMEKYEGGKKCK